MNRVFFKVRHAGLAFLLILAVLFTAVPVFVSAEETVSDTPESVTASDSVTAQGTGDSFPASPNDGDTFNYPANNVTYTYYSGRWYPQEIVDGDFSYPDISGKGVQWASVMTPAGVITSPAPVSIDNWDFMRFCWESNQLEGDGAYVVEIQEDSGDSGMNYCGEINGGNVNEAAVYQDVATKPGAVYRWSLKHASRENDFLDKMNVMIGSPESQAVQYAMRLTTNGADISKLSADAGDTNLIGYKSQVIETPAYNTIFAHSKGMGDWEAWTGTYEIPEGQTITRFTFGSVASKNPGAGNAIDDVGFTIAFPLYYDANGGTGTVPETGKKAGDTSGIYYNYYPENDMPDLASVDGTESTFEDGWKPGDLTREDCTLVGWSEEKHDPFTQMSEAEAVCETSFSGRVNNSQNGIGAFTQEDTKKNTVYAVWLRNEDSRKNITLSKALKSYDPSSATAVYDITLTNNGVSAASNYEITENWGDNLSDPEITSGNASISNHIITVPKVSTPATVVTVKFKVKDVQKEIRNIVSGPSDLCTVSADKDIYTDSACTQPVKEELNQGDTVYYKVTVTNASSSDSVVPPEVQDSFSDTLTDAAAAADDGTVPVVSGSTITWQPAELAGSGQAVMTVRATVSGNASEYIHNDVHCGAYAVSTANPVTMSAVFYKTWIDYNNALKLRPDAITFHLFKGDGTAVQSEAEWTKNEPADDGTGSWTAVFKNLPEYEPDGTPILYYVTEDAVSHYTASYSDDGKAMQEGTVTNTLQTGPVTGVKADTIPYRLIVLFIIMIASALMISVIIRKKCRTHTPDSRL